MKAWVGGAEFANGALAAEYLTDGEISEAQRESIREAEEMLSFAKTGCTHWDLQALVVLLAVTS